VDRQQDPSGDYGYDLVHEAMGSGRASEERPSGGAETERPPVDVPPEQGQDLGYDEAHDF
jgi:hypothetical protein